LDDGALRRPGARRAQTPGGAAGRLLLGSLVALGEGAAREAGSGLLAAVLGVRSVGPRERIVTVTSGRFCPRPPPPLRARRCRVAPPPLSPREPAAAVGRPAASVRVWLFRGVLPRPRLDSRGRLSWLPPDLARLRRLAARRPVRPRKRPASRGHLGRRPRTA